MSFPITLPRPVFVAGLGAIGPVEGESILAMARDRDWRLGHLEAWPGFPAGIARVPSTFDERTAFREPKAVKLADRGTRLAVAAATQAAQGLDGTEPADRSSWGVVLGRSASNVQSVELARALAGVGGDPASDPALFTRALASGLSPLWLLVNLPNMVGAHVGIQLGCCGPNHTVTSDAVAGVQAILEGALLVAVGDAPVVLAGGADSSLDPLDVTALASVWPADGPPLAEGAGVLALTATVPQTPGSLGVLVLGGYCGAPESGEVVDVLSAVARGWRAAQLVVQSLRPGDHETVGALDLVFPGIPRLDTNLCFGHALAAGGALACALAVEAIAASRARAVVVVASGLAGQLAVVVFAADETQDLG